MKIKKNLSGSKTIKFDGLKVTASKPDEAQLSKINQFTRRPFTADEVYIGQLRLANNCIDRDCERFSEEVLQRFSATAIRKTMLFDHNKRTQDSAIGKFFDVQIEKMALQQAIAEAGEDLQLPDGVTEVWFLSPSFYIPLKGVDEEVIVKIDAGICDFASIGFRAESMVPIMNDAGETLYWEYRGSGKRTEMTEGSLVYLGAQYGMSVKSADDKRSTDSGSDEDIHIDKSKQGGNSMEWKKLLALFKKLFKGKSFSEETFDEDVKVALDEHVNSERKAAADEAVKPLNEKIKTLDAEVATLKPLAEEGKVYRASLVEQYASLKQKIGDIDDKPDTLVKAKEVATGFSIDFLKAELVVLDKRVCEKFPASGQLAAGDVNQQREPGGEGKNPLIPAEEK